MRLTGPYMVPVEGPIDDFRRSQNLFRDTAGIPIVNAWHDKAPPHPGIKHLFGVAHSHWCQTSFTGSMNP